MKIRRAYSLVSLCVALSLFHLTLGQVATQDSQGAICDEAIVKSVTKQCRNEAKIRSLADFYGFYENFEHLTNKCLRPHSASNREPSKTSQLAEDECKQQNLFFYQVRQLAKLIARWQRRVSTGQVCTIEFAMRLYHFHQQIGQARGQDQRLLWRMLRLLANSVAWKCRFTLARRLRDIQMRASELEKHVMFLIGLINVAGAGDWLVDKLRPFDETGQFVPTLERELPEQLSGHARSVGLDGFELKSVSSVRLSYKSAKISCNTLKQYHVNTLGSLGLLASLGYGFPGSIEQASVGRLKLTDSRQDKTIIQSWLLSALLCQSLRNVLMMKSTNYEGKLQYRFKVMSTQEAEVALMDEEETTFATYELPENISSQQELELAGNQKVVELLSRHEHKSAAIERALVRKSHLLAGPNYRLAHAIGTYLDVKHSAGRLGALEDVIGMRLEFEDLDEFDESDEEEEEEE